MRSLVEFVRAIVVGSSVRMAKGMSALSEVMALNLRLFPPIREMNDALALGTTGTFAKEDYVWCPT